ncbi:copper-binding protein [Bordetella muralis]|uniref:copper-binding protein n=1 Tax=Bordetella muralis TaxID=1649130 RepID=UPI0039F045DA
MRRVLGRVSMLSAVTLAGVALWQPVPALAAEQQPSAKDATATASGEVRRVDAAAGKVAIKHDAISDLELPAMTLVYQASPALLANIKPGDRVRFTAARQNGKYVVTAISN